MPAELIAAAMCDVTRSGETVLAWHLGTGRALVAAEGCGRSLRGADADPARIDAAVARWAAVAGAAPTLEREEAEA